MDPLAAALARSSELFPLDLDLATDQVSLIRLTEADYRRASFLDARILTPQTLLRSVPRIQLEEAVKVAEIEETADYIFHIGHVGSTLLSRLLGAHPKVFAVREPAILRTLARLFYQQNNSNHSNTTDFDAIFGVVLKLLSRTFRPEQQSIVKATSFVSEMAAHILSRPSRPRAILLYVPAESYLATILGAPHSPKEARMLAERRLQRLQARTGQERWNLTEFTEGEMVAMSWACEMTALAATAEEAADQTLWLNFNTLLEAPAASLLSAFRHFTIQTSPAEIQSIASGAELTQYAKAPEHAYDSNLRSQILEQAHKDHGSQITRGLAWLESAATTSSHIEYVLSLR